MLYLQSNALPSTHLLYTCTWFHDQSSAFSFFFFIYDLQAQQIKSSKYISLTQICTTFFISYWSVLHLTARHVPDHHAIEALHTWKCSCQFKGMFLSVIQTSPWWSHYISNTNSFRHWLDIFSLVTFAMTNIHVRSRLSLTQ